MFIKEYVQVMTHFAKALNILQGEKQCTLVTYCQLLHNHSYQEPLCELYKPLCQAITKGIMTRFGEDFTRKDLIFAAVLPRFKVN